MASRNATFPGTTSGYISHNPSISPRLWTPRANKSLCITCSSKACRRQSSAAGETCALAPYTPAYCGFYTSLCDTLGSGRPEVGCQKLDANVMDNHWSWVIVISTAYCLAYGNRTLRPRERRTFSEVIGKIESVKYQILNGTFGPYLSCRA